MVGKEKREEIDNLILKMYINNLSIGRNLESKKCQLHVANK